MRVLSLATAAAALVMIPVSAGEDKKKKGGVRPPPPPPPVKRQLPKVCTTIGMPDVKWVGAKSTRDCKAKETAVAGALVAYDDTDVPNGAMIGFCEKCGEPYDDRASLWRAGCKSKANDWSEVTPQRTKLVSQALDAFGCTMTKEGDYCAALYSQGIRVDWRDLADWCKYFESCCFGELSKWHAFNTTMTEAILTTCPKAQEARKQTCLSVVISNDEW